MSERTGFPSRRQRFNGILARGLARVPAPLQLRLARGVPVPVEVDGQRLDPMLQLLLAAQPPRTPTPLTEGTPEEARRRFRADMLSLIGRRTRVGAVRDLEVDGAAGPLDARIYLPGPESATGDPLLVFFHGGGFVLGDLDTHDEVCRLLCRHGRQRVLSVAYRLAPEHPFPAAAEDAEAAFRWAREHAEILGTHPDRVAVGGDSAGGNLAAVVAQRTARDAPAAAQLLIYPPTDRSRARPSHTLFAGYFLSIGDRDAFSRLYFGEAGVDPTDPRCSPLLAPDLSGLPPALVVAAGFDVLRDEAAGYAEALAAAGTHCEVVREPALGHGFVQLTGVCRAAHRATVGLARRWRAMLDARAGSA